MKVELKVMLAFERHFLLNIFSVGLLFTNIFLILQDKCFTNEVITGNNRIFLMLVA
jgi:hypothetical protein